MSLIIRLTGRYLRFFIGSHTIHPSFILIVHKVLLWSQSWWTLLLDLGCNPLVLVEQKILTLFFAFIFRWNHLLIVRYKSISVMILVNWFIVLLSCTNEAFHGLTIGLGISFWLLRQAAQEIIFTLPILQYKVKSVTCSYCSDSICWKIAFFVFNLFLRNSGWSKRERLLHYRLLLRPCVRLWLITPD